MRKRRLLSSLSLGGRGTKSTSTMRGSRVMLYCLSGNAPSGYHGHCPSVNIDTPATTGVD